MRSTVICMLACWLVSQTLMGAEQPSATEQHPDLLFADLDGVKLQIDLHLPVEVERPPLVMFIHGGGWTGGDRKHCKMAWLAPEGYAVASVEYRLSQQARFPAQIHDCKGALRWLRAHADEYGYNADRVVVAGDSAGGHLAALVGVSGGVDELEGTTAGNLTQSSSVQGVIDYYGPTDFILRSEHQPAKTDVPSGSVFQLLGGAVKDHSALARLASPVTHVGADDPPLLVIHGDQDQVVYLRQSERMHEVYEQAGLDGRLLVISGAGHGWGAPTPLEREAVLEFLQRCLHRSGSEPSGK